MKEVRKDKKKEVDNVKIMFAMTWHVSIIGLFIFTLHFYGCITPYPIYSIQPAEEEVYWECGVGMINKSDVGISVLAGFTENRDNMMSFDVTIKNESDTVIIVDPALFVCIPYNTIVKDTSSNPTLGVSFLAINPEQQIHQNEVNISKENASFRSYQSSAAFGALLGLVSDITSIGKNRSDEERRQREREREKADEQYAKHKYEHQRTIEKLNNEKYYWQNIALRKTTLQSGQSIRGKVLYHHQPKAKYLLLKFPIASSIIKMWFKQNVLKVS